MSIDQMGILLVGVGTIGAGWDVSRRWLQSRSDAKVADLVMERAEMQQQLRYSQTAAADLTQLVARYEQASERNDKALVNFLGEIREITRYTERTRREAEGAAMNGARRR